MSYVSSDLSGLVSFKSISWSYFENICAVILADSTVHFFDDRGNEKYPDTFKRSARATVASFSPKLNMLAVGWSDGKITTWINGQTQESVSMLTGPVSLLSWHPTDMLLLSAAENGFICIWDCSTMILPLFQGSAPHPFSFGALCPTDSPFAFMINVEGELFTVDPTDKSLTLIYTLPKPVLAMDVCAATRKLIVISGENLLTQYSFPPALTKYSQVKLPAGGSPMLIKIRKDAFAYNISDTITIMNMQNDESLNIRVPNGQNVVSIGFNPTEGILFAATDAATLMFWKVTMKGIFTNSGWSDPVTIDSKVVIERFYLSPYTGSFFSQCTGRRPLMFRNFPLYTKVYHDIVVWQTEPNAITMPGQSSTQVSSTIERLSISNSYVIATSLTSTDIFTVRSGGLFPFSRMSLNTSLVAVSGENVYTCQPNTLEVRNLQGTVKQTLTLNSTGEARFMSCSGHFLVIVCSDHTVFTFDVSRRSPKLQFSTVFSAPLENFRIRDVSSSSGGFCVSFTIDTLDDGVWRPCKELYLHSPQFDKTVPVDFEGRVPVKHHWDSEDTRLLCIETIPYSDNFESKMTGTVVVPLFISDSLEIFRQTILTLSGTAQLSAVEIPRIYVQNSPGSSPTPLVLPQFEGLDSADEGSRKALMDLNFHLATGDIDNAFNAIRNIENKGIWRSLAQMCAQMKRIDLADLCFGKMEDPASAIILKKLYSNGDDIASLCFVDNQLGLSLEAKKVANDNRNFSALAKTQKAVGEWKEAISTTVINDRINSKLTEYQHARSLEVNGNYKEAIVAYERAGVIATELPRMALQANDLKIFFSYISERSVDEISPKLFIWIGRFYEAHNLPDQALEYFDYAKSNKEAVRLLCCTNKWDEAQKRVQKSSSRSLLVMYARLLSKRIDYYSMPENSDPQVDVEKLKHQCIDLYSRARQFAQAMEFALKYEMIDEILSLSFSSPSTLVYKAAQWFESQKESKNAILMYSRCGRMNRALALCFVTKQYDALDEISDSLNSKTDPQILLRCGSYFVESERWSKAAQCFALARHFDEVMELCNKHNIRLPSSVLHELAESQTDPEFIRRFATLCEQQTAYQIAASLYVKLKDPISALKALIRAGDTDKIIKLAKLVRKRECFILAANFIMTLNPRDGDTNFKTVEQMYSKANAPDKLARFYQSAAQHEMDEYQEYEKGVDLLKRSLEVLNNSQVPDKAHLIESLQEKIRLIEIYIKASANVKANPDSSLIMCAQLLKTPGIENSMRPDDIYILMVHCYVAQSKFQNAHKILEDLKNSGTDITWFMEVQAIQKIYSAAGHKFEPPEEKDDIDDDVLDDIEDIK